MRMPRGFDFSVLYFRFANLHMLFGTFLDTKRVGPVSLHSQHCSAIPVMFVRWLSCHIMHHQELCRNLIVLPDVEMLPTTRRVWL